MNFVEVKKTLNKQETIVNSNKVLFEKYAKLTNSIIENDLKKFSECFHKDLRENKETNFEGQVEIDTVKSLFDVVLDRNILKEVKYYNKVLLSDLESIIGVKEDVIKNRIKYFINEKIINGKLEMEKNQLTLINEKIKKENYSENFIDEAKAILDYIETNIKRNQEYFKFDNTYKYIKE